MTWPPNGRILVNVRSNRETGEARLEDITSEVRSPRAAREIRGRRAGAKHARSVVHHACDDGVGARHIDRMRPAKDRDAIARDMTT
jgi:hypothetical protein